MQNKTRRKNISTFIILAIVLLVPGFLYIALNKIGSNTYLKLPVYGEKHLSGKMNRKMGREIPDTVFHQIKPISLLDIKGDSVHFLAPDSSIAVVHTFYATDKGLSVAMLQNLRSVAERFKNNHKVKFYSISVDTADSSVDLEKTLAQFRSGLEANWFVLRGSGDILGYVRGELLSDALQKANEARKFTISNQYILIDSQRRIRGFYDINLKSNIERLEDEIKVQLVEEARNNPLKVEKK
ncbi:MULTISPECIES: SCO family protein [Sphingobacterium]|uniref:SCO family protein n=1 Tax=Sphingobacterium TaxID=28453 RepID=UPI0013DB969D|nr:MULTISPECIES: SCO family protein [unclassified Sphingobacterium]